MAAAALVTLAVVSPALGQTAPGQTASGETGSGESAPVLAIDALPDVPGATMQYKLERTIFKVDVLTLRVRVDRETGTRLSEVRSSTGRYDRERAEDIADLVRNASEGVAEIEFLRGIGLEQFLEGVDEDMGHARDAGWISVETFGEIASGLREWFAFLADRGIEKGDRLTYHVSGDTLRTTYLMHDGSEPSLDQTDVGRENVLALWGGYYARGSSFREGLARSLWDDE